jgi:GMP reductase
MPRIDNELKLSFKDVLIRPKRSNLKSRSQVDLVRPYTFKHSKRTLTSIPIIAANMDTVGTFEMAIALAKHKMLVAIHKWYSIDEWDDFAFKHPEILSNIIISSGTSDEDFKKITTILTKYKEIVNICLDIANGYSEHFVDYVKKIRKNFPNHTIIAGNVVTGEMVEALVVVEVFVLLVKKLVLDIHKLVL